MKVSNLLPLAALVAAPLVSQAVILDDFSGTLSNWTSTVILNNGTTAFNTAGLAINSGALTYATSTFDGIQQAAHIFSGRSLAIGEEVQIDILGNVTAPNTSDAIGLYVGIAPTTATAAGGSGTRASFVSIYKRSDDIIYSRGFGGSTEYALAATASAVSSSVTLFITRTASDTYELGYFSGGIVRTVLTTRVDATNPAFAIGLYTDSRANGTIASVDNFSVIPEPGSFAVLAGLAVLGTVGVKRRRK
jgi:hypothetical protein